VRNLPRAWRILIPTAHGGGKESLPVLFIDESQGLSVADVLDVPSGRCRISDKGRNPVRYRSRMNPTLSCD
jgi:hypothetical protein